MNQATITPTADVGVLYVQDIFGEYRVATHDEVIAAAKHQIAASVKPGASFDTPRAVKDYLVLHLAKLEHEVFGVLFLDVLHRAIACEDMFRGTVSQASVYPREVAKRSLALNASAVIFYHNHPSGSTEPSRADEHLTQCLKSALMLVDVRVVDHIIVAGAQTASFAERGIL